MARYFKYIYLYFDHDYDMDFLVMVMLRSIKGPYGRLMIEVAYGEMIFFHSIEAIWEMIAWEEWLGCRHDASSMFDIPGSTPVWAPYIYIYIFWFSTYQNLCICIMFSKFICSIEEHWWSLTLSWPDEVQRMISTAHEFSNVKLKS